MHPVICRRAESIPADRAIQIAARKASRLESAFVSLAAANLFIVSSAISFYVLIHSN